MTLLMQALDNPLPFGTQYKPSILFIKREKDQGLLVVFAAFSQCSPGTEGAAVSGALAGGWLRLEQWMDTLTVLTYCDTGI